MAELALNNNHSLITSISFITNVNHNFTELSVLFIFILKHDILTAFCGVMITMLTSGHESG
jgi:hypothetical protein